MQLKDKIKELRIIYNLSTPMLAAKLGKGESTIRMWETGRSNPDIETLIELSKIFDCSVDYLLGISDIKNADKTKKYEETYAELINSLKKISERDRLAVADLFIGLLDNLNNAKSSRILSSQFSLLETVRYTCCSFSRIVSDCENKIKASQSESEIQEVAADALGHISQAIIRMYQFLYAIDDAYSFNVLSNVPLSCKFEGYRYVDITVEKYRGLTEETQRAYQ